MIDDERETDWLDGAPEDATGDENISAGMVDLLTAFIQSEHALESISRTPEGTVSARALTVERLVRYLVGELSTIEMEEIEIGLTERADMRRSLVSIRSVLDRVQVLSWSELAALAQRATAMSSDAPAALETSVAEAWLMLVVERLESATHAPVWWRRYGWQTVRQQAQEGIASAQSAWAIFREFGRRMYSDFRAASASSLAFVRGPESPGEKETQSRIEGLPLGWKTFVSAEVVTDGGLHAMLRFLPSEDAVSAALPISDGLPVSLALTLQEERWPIGTEHVNNRQVEWTIAGLGRILGLPIGELREEVLCFTIGDSDESDVANVTEVIEMRLMADIMDAKGLSTLSPPVVVLLADPPRFENGQLHLSISLPAATRDVYPDYQLTLDFILSGEEGQRLGTWDVGDWRGEGETPRPLVLPCPNCPTTELRVASCLRARLIPPDGLA